MSAMNAMRKCMYKAGWTDEMIADIGIDLDDPRIFSYMERELADSVQRERNIKLQAIKNADIYDYLESYESGKGTNQNYKAGLMSLVTRDINDKGANVSMEKRGEAIVQSVHAELADLMDAYKPQKLGFADDPEGVKNMIRELFQPGKSGDPDAAKYAQIWSETMDKLRERFNKAGGAIAKLDSWYLPQRHDALRVGKAGKEDWVNYTKERLDRDKMVDTQTGLKMDDAELDDALRYVYDTIATEGTIRIEPGKISKNASGKVSNKHKEHRFLHFKDGDKWLEYQEQYGSYDAYSSMTDHVDLMSKEIGAMEVFGPDADAGLQFAKDIVTQKTGDSKLTDTAQNQYDQTLGRNYTQSQLGEVAATIKHHQVATKLGSAMISAVSDTAFMGLTASYNGMPVMKTYKRMLGILNPASSSDRSAAAKLMLGAEYALDGAIGANRHVGATGYRAMAKLSNFTMKASGLHGWTIAGKQAFGMEFLSNLSDIGGKSFNDLDPKVKKSFERYGLDANDWDQIRASKRMKYKGVDFVSPAEIADVDLQTRLVGMLISERQFAVPEPDARVRALMNRETKSGTVSGEVLRAVGTFKSFPITMLTTHLARAANEFKAGGINRLNYTAKLLVGTTALGVIAYQAKEVSKGRDPLDWDDPKLLVAGFAQGGGLGILGDFLLKDQNRYGGSLGATLAGPQVGTFEEIVLKLMIGNMQQLASGEETNFAEELLKTSYNNIPGINLWYTKLALDRAVHQNLQELIDPKYGQKQQQLMRKQKKQTGQDSWWRPTSSLPDRLPDAKTETVGF